MKNFFLPIAILTVSLSLLGQSYPTATVLSVRDGDTLSLQQSGKKTTIRMACIDAPEASQKPWGQASTLRLKQLAPIGSTVQIRAVETDHNGRLVAELYRPDGQSINRLQVASGQAFVYRQNIKACTQTQQQLLQAETQAQQQKLGIWDSKNPLTVAPWDYRQQRRIGKQPASPSPVSQLRSTVIKEIKDYAERHVKNGESLKTLDVAELYKDNSVGLTAPEIAKIYETEYNRLKQEKAKRNPLQNAPEAGWVFFIIATILGIFGNTLKDLLTKGSQTCVDWFYKQMGSRLFVNWALRRYRRELIDKHCMLHILFRPNRPLAMQEVYVPLKVVGRSGEEQVDAYQPIAAAKRLMVTGPPGSGKTMLLKRLALDYAEKSLNLPGQPIVILLELNRLSDEKITITQHLVQALARDGFPNADQFVQRGLKAGKLMLLLDGLDEVNSVDRISIIKRLRDFLDQYSYCRAIITCRTAVYRGDFADKVDRTLEVAEFKDEQMRSSLKPWVVDMQKQEKSPALLMGMLNSRPQIKAMAGNPLMLTIIAYLYTDTPFVLPHSRSEFYQKATGILLEQDEARQIPNRYPGRLKRLVLRHLALFNQDRSNQQLQDRRSVDYRTVLSQVQGMLPGMNLDPNEDAQPILDEIVERSGLLLAIDGGDKYQFAHLTVQEFFAACALLEDTNGLISRCQQDLTTWREPLKLWCGMAGDSTTVIRAVRQLDEIAALECLADAQNVSQELVDTMIEQSQEYFNLASLQPGEMVVAENDRQHDLALRALGAIAASPLPRGQKMFHRLVSLLDGADSAQRQAAALALAYTNLTAAAREIATHYNQYPEVRQPLVQLGDLAVPFLEALAQSKPLPTQEDLTAARNAKV